MSEQAQTPQKTVLVVEDNDELNRLYCKTIRAQNLPVDKATTLAEANSFLQKTPPPDIIILDLELPDGHGGDLLKQLVKDTLRHVKVVVVSGRINAQHPGERYLNAAEHILIKPISPRQLGSLVQSMIA